MPYDSLSEDQLYAGAIHTHPYSWDISIVVDEVPLSGYQVQPKDMVVHSESQQTSKTLFVRASAEAQKMKKAELQPVACKGHVRINESDSGGCRDIPRP